MKDRVLRRAASRHPLGLIRAGSACALATFISLSCSAGDGGSKPPEVNTDPRCDDGVRNGTETDVDCGGDDCDACAIGAVCIDTDDCAAGDCLQDTCRCPAGFQEDNMGECANIDDCARSPCRNGGTCTDGVESYTCECPVGFTGRTCDINTNECLQDPCERGVCQDQEDGYTCDCDDGFYGMNCDMRCSADNTQCTIVLTCDQETGEPTTCDGCDTGYGGEDCAGACDPDGTTCSEITDCEQDGTPISCTECKDGNYGDACEDTCPESTTECAVVTACDQETGAATLCESCNEGFHGDDCQSLCPVPDNCTGTITCDSQTGMATACEACDPGFKGDLCDETCATPNNCTGTTTCDQDTGDAISCGGCDAGYHGTTCTSTCSQGNCTGTVTCDQSDGGNRSCTACAAGYYGADCTTSCADIPNCDGTTTCNKSNGDAISCSDCADGYEGTLCDTYSVSCWQLLQDYPSLTSGLYTIEPTGSSGPVEVWCDMTADGGGYTFLKRRPGNANAPAAEADCATFGMQLFVPRTPAHLAAAFAVANDASINGDGHWRYLRILGIYPKVKGNSCANIAFNSGACTGWGPFDGGPYWVSDRTDISEPNGNNNVDASMWYSFLIDGTIDWYDDTEAGESEDRFMCQIGKKWGDGVTAP